VTIWGEIKDFVPESAVPETWERPRLLDVGSVPPGVLDENDHSCGYRVYWVWVICGRPFWSVVKIGFRGRAAGTADRNTVHVGGVTTDRLHEAHRELCARVEEYIKRDVVSLA
jgi:hypothetical protein